MNTKRINGLQFEAMLRNALANLRSAETKLNDLNVFPVPDGDTGTNLCLTLENGLLFAKRSVELGAYLKLLSQGMLLGARGNSGVILSQLFKGIFMELSRCGAASPVDLRNAFIRAYKVAYTAVVCPVEGTILTVTREGIEHIKGQIDRATTVEGLLSMYIGEMRKSLATTPQMLSVLREAGVVDSGAMGYIILTEGMLKYLYGELLETSEPPAAREVSAERYIDPSLFNENSAFDDGYCMEFILQLMTGTRYLQRFRLESYIEDLKLYGTSLVATQDEKRVKVHIHTLRPAKVMALSQEYGEFLTFKLDNMQLQHNEHTLRQQQKQAEHRALAVVTVANGSGLRALFEQFGCAVVLDGGTKMNPSSQEFVDAFRQLNADVIAVLPNNKNSVRVAQQAAAMCDGADIRILPTANVMEGYWAVSMDIPDCEDAQRRMDAMRQGQQRVTALAVATASRDYTHNGVSCKKGEHIALCGDELVCTGETPIDAALKALAAVPEIADKECCVIFRGSSVDEAQEQAFAEQLEARFPLLEATFLDGGQRLYQWQLGVV